MIYGTPQVRIMDDQTDRVGIRTLVLSQLWQPSRWPMTQAELDAESPPTPDTEGGMLLVGRQTRPNGGALRTFWSFEGVTGNGKDVTFKRRGESPDFGFTPGFAELPIIKHPAITDLLQQFEGAALDGEVIWPQYLSGSLGADPQQPGLAGSTASGEINPMWGTATYFAFQGGTYWYRYVAQDESEIPDIIGKIFKAGDVPGRAKSYGDRNYLGVGAPYVHRGTVLEVTEQYWLSDARGWEPKEVYR